MPSTIGPEQSPSSSGSGTFTALTGDATSTATGGNTTVLGINGVLLSGLATGLLKNTTGTGIPSIAVAGTDYLTPTGSGGGLSGVVYSITADDASIVVNTATGAANFETGTLDAIATAQPPVAAVNLNAQKITNQADGTASSDSATVNNVNNAIAGVNPAVAVSAATTAAADTSAWTYANGVAGVGATFTGPVNTAITIDGFTFTTITSQSLLVKNDTQAPSGAFNGIYVLTALQTAGTGAIFTRRLDYDQPSDMNNTGAIPIVSGTANGTTSWVLTSNIITVGTSPLTYAQFTLNPTTIQTGPLTGAVTSVGAATTIRQANVVVNLLQNFVN